MGTLGPAPKLARGRQLPRHPAKRDSPRPVPLNRKQPHGPVSRLCLRPKARIKLNKGSEPGKVGKTRCGTICLGSLAERCSSRCSETVPADALRQFQRPLPDHALNAVARSERKDEAGELAA